MQGRTEVFNRVPDMVRFLKELPEYDNELYINKKQKSTLESSLDALRFMLPVLEGISDWKELTLHDCVMQAIANSGRKNGPVLWPLRIAISGQASTPGGAIEIAYLLGREETLRRIRKAIERLNV